MRLWVAFGVAVSFIIAGMFIYATGGDSTTALLTVVVFGPVATAIWSRIRRRRND